MGFRSIQTAVTCTRRLVLVVVSCNPIDLNVSAGQLGRTTDMASTPSHMSTICFDLYSLWGMKGIYAD